MSQKNQEQQQNILSSSPPQQEEQTYECSEAISDISLELNQQKRVKQCQCTCRCKLKNQVANDAEQKRQKKRLKRKQNKLKLKNKQKQHQCRVIYYEEKALCGLQQIIKDIYALKSNFKAGEKQIENYLTIEINRDKFYEFINSIIRDQVEAIRKQITDYLQLLQQSQQANQYILIQKIFNLIKEIKQASPQIEKIINRFVSIHFDPQTQIPPFQTNLDQMTFSFLIKNYLHNTESFGLLCQIIFEKEQYKTQRQLFQLMMNAYHKFDSQDQDSEQYSDEGYESQQWDEQSTKQTINFSIQSQNESKSRKRRQRKRRIKQQYEQNYESIIKRMESLKINENQRVNCNVEEQWIQNMIRKRELYTNKTFNTQ